MKKMLSCFLTVLMLLTAMPMTYAEGESAAMVTAPYFYKDFEDGTKMDFLEKSGRREATVVEGGYGGSAYALKIAQPGGTSGTSDDLFALPELEIGRTYEISCKMKIDRTEPFLDVNGKTTKGTNGATANGTTNVPVFGYFLNGIVCKNQDGGTGSTNVQARFELDYQYGEWMEVKCTYMVPIQAWYQNANRDVTDASNMQLGIRFGANGVVNTLTGGLPITYYIDDFYVKDVSPEGTSMVTEPVLSGFVATSQTAEVSYTLTDGASGFVRTMKKAADGGWASLGIEPLADGKITKNFLDSDEGAELKLLFTPVDADGKIGIESEFSLGKVLPVFSITPAFTGNISDSTISAKVDINDFMGETELVGLLLIFDSEGACIKTAYGHHEKLRGSYNFTVSADNAKGEAAKAKLLLWQGTSDVNTTMIPLAEPIVLGE